MDNGDNTIQVISRPNLNITATNCWLPTVLNVRNHMGAYARIQEGVTSQCICLHPVSHRLALAVGYLNKS